ncbi:uncharacterized protein LAJ45_09669 [Morchella importuna]|uniref:uncharacterized protein n=1 Tax=Morchella importuna TaxID=1174673 RepID=UPI001E8D69C7|nr:uncharacterized protein LAJ45_09669 [Morchella importuna]KAH8146227.1 hypothetical protein LAJ45_09669 [Morchella importuna]
MTTPPLNSDPRKKEIMLLSEDVRGLGDSGTRPSVHKSVKGCFRVIFQERESKIGARYSSQICILHKMDLDGILHAEPSHLYDSWGCEATSRSSWPKKIHTSHNVVLLPNENPSIPHARKPHLSARSITRLLRVKSHQRKKERMGAKNEHVL